MKKVLSVLMILVFIFAGSAFAMEIKFAHVVNEKDAFQVAAVKFKELVESRSQGAHTVTIFPNAKLGRRAHASGADEDGHRRWGTPSGRSTILFIPLE